MESTFDFETSCSEIDCPEGYGSMGSAWELGKAVKLDKCLETVVADENNCDDDDYDEDYFNNNEDDEDDGPPKKKMKK